MIFEHQSSTFLYFKCEPSLEFEEIALSIMRSTITRKPLELGFLYVSKDNAHLFPLAEGSVKITALLDEDDKEVELTYNPKYRRIHGLAGFYRKHNAQIGDMVEAEVLEPLKKYKFRVKKKPVEEKLPVIKKLPKIAPLVGSPINFRGLIYAPINENGVIFLFSKIAQDLGISIEGIQVKFPDAFGKRYERDKGHSITIEFEFKSSDYVRHGHPKDGCDLIVCWEHDWKECPTQVIELKSLVKELPSK
jgi:hypothetical protein